MGSVDQILKLLNKQALVNVASSLAGTPASQLGSPIVGDGYVIFVIGFPARNEQWVARIPLIQDDSFVWCSLKPLQLAHKALNASCSSHTWVLRLRLQR